MIESDIVIIDSGLDVGKGTAISGICIERTSNGFMIGNDLTDRVGHGTIIYSIISKRINRGRVYVIKLPDCRDDYSASGLIAALEYIKQNIHCKIINISLGYKTGDDINELYNICAELSSMGAVVLSAFDNEGCYSYPAAFDCVIGVDSKNDIKNITEFDYVENSPVNILAKGNLQRIKMQDGRVLLVGGASIACAYMTSLLIDKIGNDLNFQSALTYLKTKARYSYCSNVLSKETGNRFFKITNAVIFPFAKESQAFLRFADKLQFHIQGYYDVRCSGKVGRKLTSYYEGAESMECIMDIERVDFKGVDALILGHLDELNYLSNRDYKKELINIYMRRNRFIY